MTTKRNSIVPDKTVWIRVASPKTKRGVRRKVAAISTRSKYFAITPDPVWDSVDPGDPGVPINLTHLPTGTRFCRLKTIPQGRAIAAALERLPVPWQSLTLDPFNNARHAKKLPKPIFRWIRSLAE